MIKTFCDDCQREIIKPAERRPVGTGQVRSYVYDVKIGGAGPADDMCRDCYERRGLHKVGGSGKALAEPVADASRSSVPAGNGDVNELLELVPR